MGRAIVRTEIDDKLLAAAMRGRGCETKRHLGLKVAAPA
jgi:Arc/MetJ family transcription regulator